MSALKKVPLIEIVYENKSYANGELPQLSTEALDKFNSDVIVSHLVDCPQKADPKQIADQVERLAHAGAGMIHLKTQFDPDKGYYESVDIIFG